MFKKRYTVLIADRTTGVVRRLTVNLRAAVSSAVTVFMIPVLIGLGAKWSARMEIDALKANNFALEVENGNFRATTGELTTQIQSLESVINDLGTKSAVDPDQAKAMQRLPAVVRARAVGGNARSNAAVSNVLSTSLHSPEDTFGALRSLLQGLESRLRSVSQDVERRQALAAATPSIWPTIGWLTGTFGGRADPLSGEPSFHQGLDIATDKGQPVYATADGQVESASFNGDYGNFLVLHHQFGLTTRYGHLSRFNVKPGDSVKRGDIIGYVGSTGRSTGSHLHYEILANGQLVNPLRLLTQPAKR